MYLHFQGMENVPITVEFRPDPGTQVSAEERASLATHAAGPFQPAVRKDYDAVEDTPDQSWAW